MVIKSRGEILRYISQVIIWSQYLSVIIYIGVRTKEYGNGIQIRDPGMNM